VSGTRSEIVKKIADDILEFDWSKADAEYFKYASLCATLVLAAEVAALTDALAEQLPQIKPNRA
jgi:hypothetical protein